MNVLKEQMNVTKQQQHVLTMVAVSPVNACLGMNQWQQQQLCVKVNNNIIMRVVINMLLIRSCNVFQLINNNILSQNYNKLS